MKKVGILTFHRAKNYGSALQTYALNRYINNMPGVECEVIDYTPPNQDEMYGVFKKGKDIKTIIRNLIMVYYYSFLKDRIEGFNDFVETKINISKEKYLTSEDFKKADLYYSHIICGSDQIWNPVVEDFSILYFLTEINKAIKIAYAPSIGMSDFENFTEIDTIIKSLNTFHALSIREERGKEVMENLLNREKSFFVALDPTLLIDKNGYEDICNSRVIKGDYIFFYSIDYNLQAVKMAMDISKYLKLPVVIMYTTGKSLKFIKNGFILSKKSAPGDFISLIKYAKLVLSSSFHGTAFSIIYNKPFYSFYSVKTDGSIHKDSRINNLLTKLNLNNRTLNIRDIKLDDIDFKIDFEQVNILLNEERKKSMEFLNNAINGG